MAKSLFLLLISGLMTLVWTPEILMADDFELKKQPEFNAVLTVEEPKIIEEPEIIEPVVAKPAVVTSNAVSNPQPATQPVVQATYVAPANNMSIVGKNLEVVEVDSSAYDAGSRVYKFRKMFYGHNSAAVFGGIDNASEFSVTLNGVVHRYRVMERHTFEKHSATQLSLNGQVYSMAALVNNAWGYDVIIVTCAGQSLGNGDATHRLVLFANEI